MTESQQSLVVSNLVQDLKPCLNPGASSDKSFIAGMMVIVASFYTVIKSVGCTDSIMVISWELVIGKPSSNSGGVCCNHFCINVLGKGIISTLLSLAMN